MNITPNNSMQTKKSPVISFKKFGLGGAALNLPFTVQVQAYRHVLKVRLLLLR
jgi:hypothetical protein